MENGMKGNGKTGSHDNRQLVGRIRIKVAILDTLEDICEI